MCIFESSNAQPDTPLNGFCYWSQLRMRVIGRREQDEKSTASLQLWSSSTPVGPTKDRTSSPSSVFAMSVFQFALLILRNLIEWDDIFSYMSRLVTKPTNWHVRPAKTQISLGIRPVWSESSLCAQRVAKEPIFLHADSEDSDVGAQAEDTHFVGFSCRGSYVYIKSKAIQRFWRGITHNWKRNMM